MPRIRAVAIAGFALFVLALPVLVAAHSDSHKSKSSHRSNHSFSFGDDDDFGWSIVTDGGSTTMSGLDSRDIEDLKDRFGDEFLVIRDHDERFVITDSDMIDRAQRTTRRISEYGREIGELARAQAKLALAGMSTRRDVERLREKRRELQRELDRAEREGEDTDALDHQLMSLDIQIQVHQSMARNNRLSSEERRDLERQRDKASESLRREVKKIEADMRDILREAISRGLAERVD